MANLYTVVCEFRGGTYVSQVRATDEVSAVRRWVERIKVEQPIPRSSTSVAKNVLRELGEFGVTALTGLDGVWFFSAQVGRSQLIANVVLSR